MTGRSHLTIGLALGCFLAADSAGSLPVAVAIVAAAGIAALAPDLDHPKSIISGYLPGIGSAARLFVSHRGPTHTALFTALIILFLLAIAAPGVIVLAVAAGMTSHLIADMATPAGIPMLWPVSRRAWRLAPRPVLWASAWLLEAAASVGSVALIGFVILESVR